MQILLAALLLLADVHIVDDNGPADFPDIQMAVDAALPGDTILVRVGGYAGFTLDKRLTILGQEGPFEPFIGTEPYVGGTVFVDGPATFVLAGFRLNWLEVHAVAASALVDDCTVLGRIAVDNCTQLTLSRLVMPQATVSYDALLADHSMVTLVDSDLTGGPGHSPFAGPGFAGEAALEATNGSVIVVAGSRLKGGNAGQGLFMDGPAGHAVSCIGSTVIVRGSSTDTLDDGNFDIGFGAVPGRSIWCSGGLVVHSGVTLLADVQTVAGGSIVAAPVAEPYLEITGGDLPGEQRSIDLYGPAGAAGFVLLATAPGTLAVPKLELPLWLNLAGPHLVLALPLLGQDTPQSLPLTLPAAPGLAGAALHVQAVYPGIPSTWKPGTQLVANSAPLILRY